MMTGLGIAKDARVGCKASEARKASKGKGKEKQSKYVSCCPLLPSHVEGGRTDVLDNGEFWVWTMATMRN